MHYTPKVFLHNDLHSGDILVKYNRYVKIIDFGKRSMTDDPIVYFIKPGTDKQKWCEKWYSHLACELRNIPCSKVTLKTDFYPVGYTYFQRSLGKLNWTH